MKVIWLGLACLIVLAGCEKQASPSRENEAPGTISPQTALSGNLDREKYRVALDELRMVGTALESFLTDNSSAPAAASIQELAALPDFSPFHIRAVPQTDPWGTPYFYRAAGDRYWLASAGSDRSFLGFDQQGEYSGYSGQDIVYANGAFVYSPRSK